MHTYTVFCYRTDEERIKSTMIVDFNCPLDSGRDWRLQHEVVADGKVVGGVLESFAAL